MLLEILLDLQIKKVKKKGVISYAGVSNNQNYLRDDNFFKKKLLICSKRRKYFTVGTMLLLLIIKHYQTHLMILFNFLLTLLILELKEADIFKRRILGLTSYFRSASESLLPRYEESPEYLHIEKIPMSKLSNWYL